MDALPLREFRRLDLNSEELGVPVAKLMAQAGKALATAVKEHLPEGGSVVLLCGKGNNGGDGFAAAGVLHRWGYQATVVVLEPPTALAKSYLDLLDEESVHAWQKDRRAWVGADVVVDCMLGTGVRDKPRAPYDQAIRWFNKHAGIKIACDVPSGFQTTLAAQPNHTVTFHAKKQCMTEGNSGRITVAPIGIPKDAGHVGLGDLDAGYVRPKHASHKGHNGRVLIIGGGPYTGAPHYAGMGAVRAGADLVRVATTDAAAAVIQTWGPDLLVHGEGDLATVPAASLKWADTIVIGPGLGEGKEGLVKHVLKHSKGPVAVDADALLALDESTLKAHGKRLVVTPHQREATQLIGKKPSKSVVVDFAKKYGCTVLLKGAKDLITDGTNKRECHRGHPAMTVGGTGDVLAGVVGCLLAKGAAPFDAACAAAYLVGCAGEVAAGMRSYGMTATDLHEAIPAVLLRL